MRRTACAPWQSTSAAPPSSSACSKPADSSRTMNSTLRKGASVSGRSLTGSSRCSTARGLRRWGSPCPVSSILRVRALLAAHGKYAALHDLDLSAWSAFPIRMPRRRRERRTRGAHRRDHGRQRPGLTRRLLIVLGTGIGAAAVTDGHVVRGRHGHGAILGGHITLDLDGPRCPCGNIGCAEALASTWALAADAAAGDLALGPQLAARLADEGTIGIRDLVETRDEPESAAILDRYIRTWAAVIVTQCHAFDPDVVVVTGGVMRAADVILPALRERVHADLWSSSFRPSVRHTRRPLHLGPSWTGSTRRTSHTKGRQ